MTVGTMRPSRPRAGARHAATGVAAVLLAAAGCSREEPTAATTAATAQLAASAATVGASTVPAPPAPPATPDTTGATTAATAPTAPRMTPAPTTAAPTDPTTTLMNALDALTAGYHFVTTATVAGHVAVSAEGDHVAGATRMTVTSGGTSTEYLVTAGAAWALADGAWHQLDSAEGLSDPVAQLRQPATIEFAGNAAATIIARYPAAVLGVPGGGQHPVEFQLAGDRIVSLRYPTTTSGGQPADVVAVISPIAPGTEISLPDSTA